MEKPSTSSSQTRGHSLDLKIGDSVKEEHFHLIPRGRVIRRRIRRGEERMKHYQKIRGCETVLGDVVVPPLLPISMYETQVITRIKRNGKKLKFVEQLKEGMLKRKWSDEDSYGTVYLEVNGDEQGREVEKK